MYQQMLSQIGILLLIVLIGVLARFRKILTEGITRDLNKLVIGLTLPILYFYVLVVQTSRTVLISSWYLPLLAAAIVLAGLMLSYFCAKFIPFSGAQKKTFFYLSSFTNCGFLAIPIALFHFGEAGVVRVVIFNLGFSVLIWTVGVSMLRGAVKVKSCGSTESFGKRIRKCGVFNTGTAALALGFLGVGLGLKLPFIVDRAFGLLGGITIPLAMLVIGGVMAGREVHKKISIKIIIPLVLIRLLIIPAAALTISKLLSFPPLIQGIFVLQAGMPSASTTPLFVQRYGGDADLAGSGVFFTHLLSIITVPFWMSLI